MKKLRQNHAGQPAFDIANCCNCNLTVIVRIVTNPQQGTVKDQSLPLGFKLMLSLSWFKAKKYKHSIQEPSKHVKIALWKAQEKRSIMNT